MNESARFRVNAPEVVHQIIDSEAVVIDLARGNYYSLERAAAEVWEWLDGGAMVGEMASRLAHRYDGSPEVIEAALQSFLGELEAEGLIARVESHESTTASPFVEQPLSVRPAFEAPRISKFTDMQDLLLLDPIHEVDPSGWPQLKT